MPKLTGIFANLEDLDKIPISDVDQWVKSKGHIRSLEDYVGNRILYPETVAVTKIDLEADLAIFVEAIKRSPDKVYDKVSKSLFLQDTVVARFPPLLNLVTAVSRVIAFETIVTPIILRSQKVNKLVGSLITPPLSTVSSQTTFVIEGKVVKPRIGAVSVIHSSNKNINVKIGNLGDVLVPCGQLGVIIDLRGKR